MSPQKVRITNKPIRQRKNKSCDSSQFLTFTFGISQLTPPTMQFSLDRQSLIKIKLPYSSDKVVSQHKSTVADVLFSTSPTGYGTAVSLSFEPCHFGGRAVCWGIKAAVLSLAFSVILRPSILVRLQEIEPSPSLTPFCNLTLSSPVSSPPLCACSMVSLIS